MSYLNEDIYADWKIYGYGLTFEEAIDAHHLSRETRIQYSDVLFAMSKLKMEGLQGLIWGVCRRAAGGPRSLFAMRLKHEVDQHIALVKRFTRATQKEEYEQTD